MSCHDVIITRRSIRQFGPRAIPRSILEKLVDAARLAPSAANRQPLEFMIIDEDNICRRIFPWLKWAAYISPEGNPIPGQEPKAYIIVLVNRSIVDSDYERDVGAAIENILLSAWGEGVGSCWILSADKARISDLLGIPSTHSVDSVIALGYPAESPVLEDSSESIKYWKDDSGRLHVPKRPLSQVLHLNRFFAR